MEGKQQNIVIDYLVQKKRRKIITGGDGRCDSPGYLAKHGVYLITDMDVSMVSMFQLLLSPFNSKELHSIIKNCSCRADFFSKHLNHCDQ